LLPAPGSGKYYDFKFYIELTQGSFHYGGGTYVDVFAPSFGGIVARWDTKVLFDDNIPAGDTIIVSGTSTSLVETIGNGYYSSYTFSTLSTSPVTLNTTLPGLGGGNGTALAKIWYNLITIG